MTRSGESARFADLSIPAVLSEGMNDDIRLILLAGQSGGVVTSDDVRAIGLSTGRWRRRTDDGAWIRVTPHHWRHAATPLTWEMEVRTGLAWLGENAALYGPTAAAWWGLDGVARIGRAQFVVPRGRRSVVGPLDVRTTTRWSAADLLVHRGLRCTSVTRTLIDLAAGPCTAHQLAAAIDSGLRTRRTSVPTIRRRVEELGGRGRSGATTLRELLRDAGGESFLERPKGRSSRSSPPPTFSAITSTRS